MNIRNTYWIVTLGLILSLTLVLPFCGHADISELFSHHQEMSAHAMHGQHSDSDTDGAQCDCGHEFVKDYQKTKKTTDGHSLSLSSAVVLEEQGSPSVTSDVLIKSRIHPEILSDSDPPIHLLNSVFLN